MKMCRNILTIICLMVTPIIIFGCSSAQTSTAISQSESGEGLMHFESSACSFDYPSEWIYSQPVSQMYKSIIVNSNGDGSNIHVVVEPLTKPLTPSEYFDKNKTTLRLMGFKDVEPQKTTLNDRDAFLIERKIDLMDDDMYQGQIFSADGSNGYVVTYTASKDNYQKDKKAWDTVISTLSFNT